ncbi:MAG: hypothetical protein KatS3mg101_1065 [Patescibacteria group bacterium]|nr:MAG: hypothetical protein KatS3mg101_1065 [Patescibacteria group bacterium]
MIRYIILTIKHLKMALVSLQSISQKIMWFFMDKCTKCGGELYIWSAKKAHCIKCGAKN